MLPKYRNRRKLTFLIILFAMILLACILTDIVPDPCSTSWLIGKINLANLDPGTYTIDLDPGCVYELDDIDNSFPYGDNGLPVISTPIVIHGNSATIQRSAAAGTPEFRFFFIDSNGSLTLEDVTVINGNTGSATDIYNSGGAILSHEGSLTIIDSTISDNYSKVSGGAIVVVRSNLTITNSTFTGNQIVREDGGGGSGGAVAVQEGTLMTITNSEFINNFATKGGSIFILKTNSTITNSTFTGNEADGGWGGAIESNASELTIADSEFTDNYAQTLGGAIGFSGDYFDGFSVTLYDLDFIITGSTFTNNRTLHGGAIAISNAANLTITDSTFVGNQAIDSWRMCNYCLGSVIRISEWSEDVTTDVSISGSTFDGNETDGSATIYDSAGSRISIEKSTFANNIGIYGPGGIWTDGNLSIENSTFSGNSGSCSAWSDGACGAAIHSTGSGGINYSTIVNNSGPSSGAAVFSQGGYIKISGSIIANNIGGDCGFSEGGSIGSSSASLDSDSSCLAPIMADPLVDPLADNGGLTQTHALQFGSPAIDAGGGSCPADDQRSVSRPKGAGCDLGAYETTPLYWCEDLLGITILEDGRMRIQISTPELPAGTYNATVGRYDFTCQTYYDDYPDRLFCDGPKGEGGTLATLTIFDPSGMLICEETFSIPARDVPDEPEEKGCWWGLPSAAPVCKYPCPNDANSGGPCDP